MESVVDLKDLTTRAGAGQASAFEELYRHMVDRIFAYVASRTATRESAQEVTQDAFIELYRSLPKFTYRSDEAFYGFLFTIVKRQLAQHYAAQKVHATTALNDDTVVEETRIEESLSVTKALASLDEVTREIMVLHHWSRFTFGEIATMLGMQESAVRVRHHRALATLSPLLEF